MAGTAVSARKPIPPVSPKRARENRVRKAVMKVLFPEPARCAVPWCTVMGENGHEPLTRARGGSITDPSNILPACNLHNSELTAEPKWAYDLGLLRHSWNQDGEPPAGAMTREAAALLFGRDKWCVHCGSTRTLRPWLRQEHGEHQGCVCGWVLMCGKCRDLAVYDADGEMEGEGLVITGRAVPPYLVAVALHMEGDRGGVYLLPACDGLWVDAGSQWRAS